MTQRASNGVYLTILTTPDPNLSRVYRQTAAPTMSAEMLQPFRVDSGGQIAIQSDRVKRDGQHILSALLTNKGERVMTPTYGVGVQANLFESVEAFTGLTVATQLRSEIAKWEPDAEIMNVDARPDPNRDGLVVITVSYRLNPTNEAHSVVVALDGTRVEV